MLRLRVKLRPGSKLPAVSAVLDRARSRIPRAELRNLVMGDPGTGDYVAAYGRVLDGGVGALLEEQRDGVPLIHSFDITENLLLAHSCAGESVHHRWFSVMAACIELLGAADVTYAPFSQSLAGLLVDTFALNDARAEGAPLDLMPLACRELKTSASAPSEAMLALVGELCTALRTEAETEATCRELSALHDTSQEPLLLTSPRVRLGSGRGESPGVLVLPRRPAALARCRTAKVPHSARARERDARASASRWRGLVEIATPTTQVSRRRPRALTRCDGPPGVAYSTARVVVSLG